MSVLSFKQELTPEQLEAVESLNGPLLILAGAGSGKTRALIYRVANLVLQGEATPGQILAVTFTNKASKEMKTRIQKLLHQMSIPIFEELWVSTFHSLCAKILRQHIYLLGYQPFFAIYDEGDQLSLIKKILQKLNINEQVHNPKGVKSKINAAKTQGVTPQKVEEKTPYLMSHKEIEIYSEYELEMKASNALDFADLLYKTYELFKTYPDVLQIYQDKFRYIMVDEYQDTNHIQYLLIRLLSDVHKNLCVVGDEDQSIYSWRGADISNILDFEKDFPNAKVIKLEENHRSTKNIVEAASKVISNNIQRKNKTLFTNRSRGEPIFICGQMDDYREAQYVVQKIRALMGEGTDTYKDFAVFYRTNAQSRAFEDQLRHQSIPYKLVGGIKFYARKEIKDILGYMKLAINSTDDIAFKRIVNTPTRGIGSSTVAKIEKLAGEQSLSLLEACQQVVEQKVVSSGVCKKLKGFSDMMDHLKQQTQKVKVSDIYHLILDRTEYVQRLRMENTPEALARVDNLEEFNNAILQFEDDNENAANLQNFLETMSLISDSDHIDEDPDAVTLMTLHVSKGLEYPNVFIVGMEEGLFPTSQALDSDDLGAMEEERRLAYVGMTRAQRRLFLTYAYVRRVWGQERHNIPSRFIDEIPEKYVQWEEFGSSHRRSRFLQKQPRSRTSKKKSGRIHPSHLAFNESHSPNNDNNFDHMPDYENDRCDDRGSYKKGMRVRHPQFGVGSIYRLEGQGENLKISIMFPNRMMKKFVAKFTQLERL